MRLARFLPLILLVSFISHPASAQDDLLAPLTPAPKQPKKVKRKKPSRSRRAQKPAPKPEDDFLAPLVQKTELQVKVAGELGAKLFIDGEEVGVASGEPVEVKPGRHSIAVKRAGYADARREVTVPEGKKLQLTVDLEAVAGVLTVNANVPRAKVHLDGALQGTVPLRELLVTPGIHELKISADGHQTETTRLLVKAGKDYTVNAELRAGRTAVASADRPERTELSPSLADEIDPVPLVPNRPEPTVTASSGAWYQQWYVWAGAGAVVAGAVATSFAIANSGPDLTRNPDSVCGGPCAGVLIPGVR